MQAKTYAAFPLRRPGHASKSVAEGASIAGTVTSLRSTSQKRARSVYGNASQKKDDRKPSRDFEAIFGKVAEDLHSLYIAEKQKDKLNGLLVEAYQVGVALSKLSPMACTEASVANFFSTWERFANELSEHYEKNGSERLRAFIESTIATVKDVINPLVLKNLKDNAAWVSDKNALENGLSELREMFRESVFDIAGIQRTIYELMNGSESSVNAFFRQSLVKSSVQQEIVYQCHYRFSRMMDAVYDFDDDEPLVHQVMSELNKVTDELHVIFKPYDGRKDVQYLDVLMKKARNRNGRRFSLPRRNGSTSRSEQMASVMRLSKVTSEKVESGNEAKVQLRQNDDGFSFTTPRMMYLQKIDRFTLEIDELKKRHQAMKDEIAEHMSRKTLAPAAIEQVRHRRYITTYHYNMMLNDTIKFLKENIALIQKDIQSWRSINLELEQGKETQTIFFSNDKLQLEIKELNAALDKSGDDLEFVTRQRERAVSVNEQKAGRDDILLAWRSLVFESDGYEQLNFETESCALGYQSRIEQLRRNMIQRPKKSGFAPEGAQGVRELLNRKKAEMGELRKLIEQARENRVDQQPVQEVDRYWISEDTPEELSLAQQRLADSRQKRESMIDYARSVQAQLVAAVVESEQQQVEIIHQARKLKKNGIDDSVSKFGQQEYEKQMQRNIGCSVKLTEISSLFDTLFGHLVKSMQGTLAEKVEVLQSYIAQAA